MASHAWHPLIAASAAFSCAGRMACRALYSSTGSKSAACAFSSAYSVQSLIQLGGVFLLLRLQLFQAGLHGGNILAERLCACIFRILKFLQKKRLFGTQFFQIFCQLGNADSQRLVAFHMVYWQFLFLSNQRFALLALFLDLLHQTGVTLQLRLPYGKRFLNMRFATANMRELITEDQHTAAQLLQPLRNGGNGAGDQCGQLLDFSFQLPQQRIVCLDLPVNLAAVRDDSLALQRLCRHAFMDGRNLIQSPVRRCCGGQCVPPARRVPDNGWTHQPMPPAMLQAVLRCSSARRWDSVCRSGCFWDACQPGQALVLRRQREPYTPFSYRLCTDTVSPNHRFCAALNSAAVKPRSSPFFIQRYHKTNSWHHCQTVISRCLCKI